MFDGFLNMSLSPKCVVTCTMTLGNEQRYMKSPCIFATLFFEVYLGCNTPYVFDLKLIQNPVTYRIYLSIFTDSQNIK